MRILLVDDEIEMADAVARVLIREGYNVDRVHEGAAGRERALSGGFDLLILDWMLPGMTGLEICRSLRDAGQMTPVLFLTAKDTLDDRVDGLDAGADDYLVKPFELRELLARVRALLRRPSQITNSTNSNSTNSMVNPIQQSGVSPLAIPEVLRVEDLELHLTNQVAIRSGRSIELSDKETQLLAYLMQFPHQLLTHDRIAQHLWHDSDIPPSNALAAQIRLLRRKIESPGCEELIHTVYGKGYRFGSPSAS
jgi:two-component system, OmpR family, manganese sensing response regulator